MLTNVVKNSCSSSQNTQRPFWTKPTRIYVRFVVHSCLSLSRHPGAVELDRKGGKASGQKLTEKTARREGPNSGARAMDQAKEVEVRKLR
jgi:hypothetical protein